MQYKNKAMPQTQETTGEDGHQMVVSLQSKLNEAVSKIVELTKVLTHLNTEYTAEAYYEESAKRAMEPVLAAAQSNYGGTNASNYAKNP